MSKILVETSTKLVKYAFDDDHTVTLDSEKCVADATSDRKKLIARDVLCSNALKLLCPGLMGLIKKEYNQSHQDP